MNPSIRGKQLTGWTVLFVFIAGIFFAPIGAFTSPIMGAWLAGTQRVRRGFVLLVTIGLITGSVGIVRGAIHAGPGALAFTGWALVALIAGAVPFTLHRITSPRLPGFLSTLPLPVFAVVFSVLEAKWMPANAMGATANKYPAWLAQSASIIGPAAPVFLAFWFAAALVWAWNQEFRWSRIREGAIFFAGVCIAVGVFTALGGLSQTAIGEATLAGAVFNWACFAAALVLAAWVPIGGLRNEKWTCRPETLQILRSPVTGHSLRLENEGRSQMLVNAAGERFPVRDGIPDLRRPEDLTGDNGKYNRLYETIGGFYNDIQRVVCALQGFDREAYLRSYMDLLEVKAGDAVLETSVGTGLNFKYLPRGATLTGIDLSPEMLANCQTNLQRSGLEADLFLANAECLPFADESFDVVFHVGGINFFNDRARAIAEMIRVARPGCKFLIADETEEHVKAMYESGPITDRYYKDRKEPVKPPVDLVPAEMQETHLEILKPMGKNRFYALTFRKPARVERAKSDAPETCASR